MRNSETGEFELVVGNRQLLSGFFIVVLLFAVMFSMGYIVGRNSSPSARMQAETASAPAGAAKEARPQPASPANPISTAAAPQPTDAQAQPPATDAAPQPTTQPAQQPAAPPAAPPAAASAPAQPPAEAIPGSYWQVGALDSSSADVVVKTLKDKGFPASTAPGPNNLVRVLVGPYQDTRTMAKAKTDLEDLGFSTVLRK